MTPTNHSYNNMIWSTKKMQYNQKGSIYKLVQKDVTCPLLGKHCLGQGDQHCPWPNWE